MSNTRGISTVFDVLLCLMIVSAAIGMLVYMDDEQNAPPETAGDTASMLGTTTAAIEYSPAASENVDPRTDYGTIASLLATAAIMNATVDGQPLVTADAYQQAVAGTTKETLVAVDEGLEITARWEPIENGSVHGKQHIGERPPPGADVEAAALTVTTAQWEPANLREPTVDAVAATASRTMIDQLFDPQAMTRALESTHDERSIALARYRQAGSALGVDLAPALQQPDAGQANAMLADALADQLAEELHQQYDRPERAAAAINPGEVTIIIRRWS